MTHPLKTMIVYTIRKPKSSSSIVLDLTDTPAFMINDKISEAIKHFPKGTLLEMEIYRNDHFGSSIQNHEIYRS
jgi:hypothetical protein